MSEYHVLENFEKARGVSVAWTKRTPDMEVVHSKYYIIRPEGF